MQNWNIGTNRFAVTSQRLFGDAIVESLHNSYEEAHAKALKLNQRSFTADHHFKVQDLENASVKPETFFGRIVLRPGTWATA
jgi:hypothetical protein